MATPVIDFEAAIRKYHLLRPDDVDRMCSETHRYGGLVAGFLGRRSVSMLVGDSGLGKSPLAYQLGLCVAEGIPFLGMATEQGPVIYADFENGLQDSRDMRNGLARFLNLTKCPENFFCGPLPRKLPVCWPFRVCASRSNLRCALSTR